MQTKKVLTSYVQNDSDTGRKISAGEKIASIASLHAMILNCSHTEAKILSFIWMRGYPYDKEWVEIYNEEFVYGTYTYLRDAIILHGLGIDERHIRAGMKGLLEKELITRKGNLKQNGRIRMNYRINFEKGLDMLKKPKNFKEPPPEFFKEGVERAKKSNLKQPKARVAESVRRGVAESVPLDSENILFDSENKRKYTAPTARKPRIQVEEFLTKEKTKEKIQESLARAESKSKAAADKKQARAEKIETVAGLETTWAAEVKSMFPEYQMQGWTRKDLGMAAQLRKKWAADNNGDKLAPFLKWAIQNWSRMMKAKFSWMNNPAAPIYPKLDFLIWKKQEFIECFSDEKFLTQQLPITSRDKEIMLLKRRGMTHSQAVEEVDRREVKSKFIDDLAKEKREAEWYALANKQKADKLEKENRELVNRHGAELQEKVKRGENFMNPGSYKPKPLNRPRDADGLYIFEE